MRFRLRTLVILTAVVPPALWGLYVVLKPPGRLYWTVIFALAIVVCMPIAIFRLYIVTRMR